MTWHRIGLANYSYSQVRIEGKGHSHVIALPKFFRGLSTQGKGFLTLFMFPQCASPAPFAALIKLTVILAGKQV